MDLQSTGQNYSSLLKQLLTFFESSAVAAMKNCATALTQKLSQKSGDLSQKKVLVAFGGGKDSSYMLAYVRILQLLIFQEHQTTFVMRVVSNRHTGMPQAVMDNIHHVYTALQCYNDNFVQTLLVNDYEVNIFHKNSPLPEKLKQKNRKDILMNGHYAQADGRPTFCNACNFSMANSFGLAAWYEGGVDLIVTGDSKKEQRDYALWVKRMSKKLVFE